MTTYLGFNIADSMFDGECLISRSEITVEQFKVLVKKGVVSCLNRFHPETVNEFERRYEIALPIPNQPSRIQLNVGDQIALISLRGLPRHTINYQYTKDEVARASFVFSVYTRIQ